MPADYLSTARALSLPVDGVTDFPAGRRTIMPTWQRRQSLPYSRAHINTDSKYSQYRTSILDTSSSLYRQAHSSYRRLSPIQRILVAVATIIALVLGVLFLVFNESIFEWLAPVAQKWRDISGGWTILWAATFIVSFPPLIGYSSCVTLAGFVYGFPAGWPIIASATVLGSTASFLASRTVLSRFVDRLLANDTRFTALSHTLQHDGLKLLVMIRLCPLPYSLSNGAISTFPTVHWTSFMLATALASPRLLIHVFIGSRLRIIADEGGKMDFKTKVVNWGSIAFGILLGMTTGWIIYRQTRRRARELAEEEGREGEVEQGTRPFARRVFSDDPEQERLAMARQEAAVRRRDDVNLHDQEEDNYRDSLNDDHDADVFRLSDGDEADVRELRALG